MVNTERICKFSAAVTVVIHGLLKEQKSWNVIMDLVVYSNILSVKTCLSSRINVRHLTKEISRLTKFLIDKSVIVKPTLTTTDYRRSPLVSRGLEISSLLLIFVFYCQTLPKQDKINWKLYQRCMVINFEIYWIMMMT